ncbi:hypothetical protein FRC10_004903 [Ceratobasidium sp. 414]|nr:hypothetical protein FRC10_004903 [Ceratobasidium sp. 414]
MTRFLASPTSPSSSPPTLSGNFQSPSVPPSPEHLDISFYGAGLDTNELDGYYQLASPASVGSLLSRSASFYTHFSSRSSTSQGFQSLSPIPASSTADLSSPMFPPPASPPPFATQLSSQAHTSSQNNHSTPPSPVLASASVYPRSSAVGPPSMALPPSSPLPNVSSSPFEGDPFVVGKGLGTARFPGRTGIFPISDDAYLLDYELPNVEPSSASRPPAHVERRGRVYSTHTRPAKVHPSLLGARASVTKAPRIQSKALIRGRTGEPNHPAANPRPTGPSTLPERDHVSTSPLGPYIPYLSPVSSAHTPAPTRFLPMSLGTHFLSAPTNAQLTNLITAPSLDVCATSFVPAPFTPTRFGSSSSSQAISAQFTLPTPAMTASFATPSTATSLTTPASISLLCPPEIVEPHSTPANFVTRPRGGAKRRKFMRHATPSPISVPEYVRELVLEDDQQNGEVGVKAAARVVCTSADGEAQAPGKAKPDTQDLLARGEGANIIASTKASDQSPEAVEPVQRLTRSKRAREESAGDAHVAKKVRYKSDVPTRNETAKIEPETPGTEFALARLTRSQVRAVAALLAPNTSAERPGKIEDDPTSPAPLHEQTEAAPPAQQASSSVRRSRRALGRPPAPTRGQVAGRAPSWVKSGNQTATDPGKASRIKTGGKNTSASAGRVQERRAKAGHDNDNANMARSGSHSPIPSRSKSIVPSEVLPRPNKAVIFGSDGNIKQRTFPKGFPVRAQYERWYRRFPVSSYFLEKDPAKTFVLGDGAPKSADMQPSIGSGALVPNRAYHFNLYTARLIHGVGTNKIGLCPICVEPVWRGGEGKTTLLNIKVGCITEMTRLVEADASVDTQMSVFNYHMQYYHGMYESSIITSILLTSRLGICSQTGLPFSPPVAFRHKSRKPVHTCERSNIEQGKCHSCEQWINIESIKHGDILVPELHWYALSRCFSMTRPTTHSMVEGDQNPYLEDTIYLRLREYESRVMSEAGNDQKEHAALPTGQGQASAGAALVTISESLDKINENSNAGSGSSQPNIDGKTLLESAGILGNLFGTVDSDSDLTDSGDDG